jgi:hypothetical protein
VHKNIGLVLVLATIFTGAGYAQTVRPPSAPVSPPSTQAPMTAAPAGANEYKTEAEAKRACGTDPVVWANLKSKTLHTNGDEYYGKTKEGAFMCQSVAVKEGMHMSKSNG